MKILSVEEIKGKNILFGFSLETGELSSVAIIDKASFEQPNTAGWLRNSSPPASDTEEFRLADAVAWLAVNAPGYGRFRKFELVFDLNGKIQSVTEL